ncbi:MAG: superoxide dismutase family protein [Chloroflexota bacterium]|nr:superoxide dismutase family protein [Chloroflexota bacterium]
MARIILVTSVLAAALVGIVARTTAQEASPDTSEAVEVVLQDVDGQQVGRATLGETPDGLVVIDARLDGVTSGEHGIHVHAFGVCDPAGDMPFASAGGHYNPTGALHGGPPTMGVAASPAAADAMATPDPARGHAGDLGNITVLSDETGRLQITTERFRLADLGDADGSALVVHAQRDDLITDPSGNSGGRIACGVIFPSQDGGTPASTPAT